MQIQIQDLSMTYPSGKQALQRLDLDLTSPSLVGLLGPNGAGKSTLMKLLVAALLPTQGSILVDGRPLDRSQRALKARLGYLPQSFGLYDELTVYQFLDYMAALKGLRNSRSAIDQVIRAVNLEEKRRARIRTLSGGQRQRVGIARALALNPEFIVCDEPISALDVSIQAQVVNMLMKFQRELGLTYLFIAHDLSMVRHIADETAVMYLGTMVEYGPTEEVYGHPAHPYTQGLLSAVPVADPDYEKTHHRIPMEGEVPSPIDPKPGCRFCGRCPRATEQCRTQTPAPKDLSGGHFAACHHLD